MCSTSETNVVVHSQMDVSSNGTDEEASFSTTSPTCSLYEAIQERYSYDDNDLNESLKNFVLLFNKNAVDEKTLASSPPRNEQPPPPSQTTATDSPRKLNSLNSRAIVINKKDVSCVGTPEQMLELSNKCQKVIELDLSSNKFKQWSEIKNILETFKNLRFLNLSANPDLSETKESDEVTTPTVSPPPIDSWPCMGHNLSTLILNRCFIDFALIEKLLARLPNLNELYLAHNNYDRVAFTPSFVNSNLRILYFNNNQVADWHEIVKLGAHFEQLETLVLSENPIDSIKPTATTAATTNDESNNNNNNKFRQLKQLTLNKLNLSDWSDLERLKKECSSGLKHLKISNIPLLNEIKNDDEKFAMLLAYFGDFTEFLNGSPVGVKERDAAERKFLRYFMDRPDADKPARYYELESKHGKLDRLAEVNFDKDMFAQVKIRCGEKNFYERVDTRQTVRAFKTYLEKYANCKSADFRLYYIDVEMIDAFGRDELKLPNVTLGRVHVKSGDEFEIELKKKI